MQNTEIPPAVLNALNHVREYHPEVCLVVFKGDTRWRYMDDDFNAPKFGKEISTSILEAAQNAVDKTCGFPAVFQLFI